MITQNPDKINKYGRSYRFLFFVDTGIRKENGISDMYGGDKEV